MSNRLYSCNEEERPDKESFSSMAKDVLTVVGIIVLSLVSAMVGFTIVVVTFSLKARVICYILQ